MPTRTRNRPPLGGIAVVILAVLTLAVAVVAQPGCNAGGANAWGGAVQPMELQGTWLGLRLATTDSTAARQMGIPPATSGVVVTEVTPGAGSPAAQLGIAAGDVIVGVDGKPVSNLSNLYTLTTELTPGKPMPLELVRRGQPMTVMVQPPMAMPAMMPASATMAGMPPMAAPMAPAMVPPAMGMSPVAGQMATTPTACPHCGGPVMR